MEDQDQNIHLKNLSTHPASNEEDALNLLFLGDTNRMIAEARCSNCVSLTLNCPNFCDIIFMLIVSKITNTNCIL